MLGEGWFILCLIVIIIQLLIQGFLMDDLVRYKNAAKYWKRRAKEFWRQIPPYTIYKEDRDE